MRCLSVAQPWAHAIIYGTGKGHKTVENRKWYTPYRGPLLIHAGKTKQWLEGLSFKEWQEELSLSMDGDLTFGAILGQVDLITCVRKESVIDGDRFWAQGPFCWILRNPKPLEKPIPYRGQQSLFDVDLGSLSEATGEQQDMLF